MGLLGANTTARASVSAIIVICALVALGADAATWESGCSQDVFDSLEAANPTGCFDLAVTDITTCRTYCVDTTGSGNSARYCSVEDNPFDSEIFQYCLCGSSREGCAENRCDNNCLNTRVTIIQLAAGGAFTAALFIFGELFAWCRGTKDDLCSCGSKNALCFMTTYGLYYVIFFLTLFDWMSDVAWLFVDVLDSNFQDIFEEKGLNYYVFFVVSVTFLAFSTVAAFIPFMVADFQVHFSMQAEGDAPACVAPYSWLPCRVPFTDRTFQTLQLKPVIVMRMVLLNILLLDLPQISLQVFLSVITKDVSTTTIFSFVMAFLNMTLAPFVVWKQLNPKDKFWLRALMTKKAARRWKGFAATMRKKKSGIEPDATLSPIPYAHASDTPKGVGSAFADLVGDAQRNQANLDSTLTYEQDDDTIITQQPHRMSDGYTPQDMGASYGTRIEAEPANVDFQEYNNNDESDDGDDDTEELQEAPRTQRESIEFHEYGVEDNDTVRQPPQLFKGPENGSPPSRSGSSHDMGIPPPKYQRPPSGQFSTTGIL